MVFITQTVLQQHYSAPQKNGSKPMQSWSTFVAINVALISFFLILGHHFNFYYFSCPINALRCSSKESEQIAKLRRMTMTWPLALPWNSSFSVIPWKCSSFFTALETWLKQGCQHMFLCVRHDSDSGAVRSLSAIILPGIPQPWLLCFQIQSALGWVRRADRYLKKQ